MIFSDPRLPGCRERCKAGFLLQAKYNEATGNRKKVQEEASTSAVQDTNWDSKMVGKIGKEAVSPSVGFLTGIMEGAARVANMFFRDGFLPATEFDDLPVGSEAKLGSVIPPEFAPNSDSDHITDNGLSAVREALYESLPPPKDPAAQLDKLKTAKDTLTKNIDDQLTKILTKYSATRMTMKDTAPEKEDDCFASLTLTGSRKNTCTKIGGKAYGKAEPPTLLEHIQWRVSVPVSSMGGPSPWEAKHWSDWKTAKLSFAEERKNRRLKANPAQTISPKFFSENWSNVFKYVEQPADFLANDWPSLDLEQKMDCVVVFRELLILARKNVCQPASAGDRNCGLTESQIYGVEWEHVLIEADTYDSMRPHEQPQPKDVLLLEERKRDPTVWDGESERDASGLMIELKHVEAQINVLTKLQESGGAVSPPAEGSEAKIAMEPLTKNDVDCSRSAHWVRHLLETLRVSLFAEIDQRVALLEVSDHVVFRLGKLPLSRTTVGRTGVGVERADKSFF